MSTSDPFNPFIDAHTNAVWVKHLYDSRGELTVYLNFTYGLTPVAEVHVEWQSGYFFIAHDMVLGDCKALRHSPEPSAIVDGLREFFTPIRVVRSAQTFWDDITEFDQPLDGGRICVCSDDIEVMFDDEIIGVVNGKREVRNTWDKAERHGKD